MKPIEIWKNGNFNLDESRMLTASSRPQSSDCELKGSTHSTCTFKSTVEWTFAFDRYSNQYYADPLKYHGPEIYHE